MDILFNQGKVESLFTTQTLPFCIANQKNTLLLNYSSLNTLTNPDLLSQFMLENSFYHLVIFSIPLTADIKHLKNWPRLKGIFYEKTQSHIFEQGLKAIHSGELWFPRSITNIWMKELLESEQKTSMQTNNLTEKEINVLKLLSSGLSCSKIADTLFISEATVRVHLHKIYQKLNVKNKQKALQWCEKHLKKVNNSMD